MYKYISSLILFLLLFTAISLHAQLTLPPILTDNMVLQRNTEVKLWGKSKAGMQIVVSAGWTKITSRATADDKGNWLVKVKTFDAGGPFNINISSGREKVSLHNIMLGEVWLCSGQSNMDMPIRGYADQPILGANDELVDADNNQIRLFTVNYKGFDSPQDTCSSKYGAWKVASAESVSEFSAVAYFYAKQLQRKLNIPIGIITSSWGGSRIEPWISKETIVSFPEAMKQTSDPKLQPQSRYSCLYNGMIYPLFNYVIKGAIWYQGESNIWTYKGYAELMQAMVNDWRKGFGVGEFPFYYVQIAPYFYNNSKALAAAFLRDEQLKAMQLIPNSGMAVTNDLGEEKVIHIADKNTVSKRLSYWALEQTYGIKGIRFKAPTYKAMTVKDTIVYIDFNDALNGFSSFGKIVSCFEIAGEDKVFYPASSQTNRKNQILVWSSKVKIPVAVRYCFHNFSSSMGFYYNTAGLPLSPFRTDSWEDEGKPAVK